MHVVDLACGSGSTLRTLHSHLPARQHWDLVDNDPDLLALARNRNLDKDVTLKAVPLDLSRDFEAALGEADRLDHDLGAARSGLRDMAASILARVAARALPVYAALTYDGRTDSSPADPLDTAIISAVNAHQRTDKGFGPALGPSAAGSAIAGFESLGYSLVSGESDWVIGPDDRAMQNELLEGWASAAREIGTLSLAEIANWLTPAQSRCQPGSFIDARRSRRFLRIPELDALSRQIAVEQHVAFHLVNAHRHTWRLVRALAWRQAYSRTSAAQHDGRNGHVQPVETASRQKARYGIGAALDQDPAHPGARQRIDDRRRLDISLMRRQSDDLDAGRRRGSASPRP